MNVQSEAVLPFDAQRLSAEVQNFTDVAEERGLIVEARRQRDAVCSALSTRESTVCTAHRPDCMPVADGDASRYLLAIVAGIRPSPLVRPGDVIKTVLEMTSTDTGQG